MKHNNLQKTKRFLIPILSLVIMSIISIATINTYINISMFKTHMQDDINTYKKDYLEKNKYEVYKKVHLVNDSIKFQLTKIENKLKKSLKERIQTSLDIAQFIYEKQKGKIPNSEIKKRISEHLSAIRFNEDRGYYYTYDFDTNIIIGHVMKKFIGRDMTNFKDTKGLNLVNSQKLSIKNNKIGYSKLYFNKPNNLNEEYPKIVCVTKFEPLNLVIGTGEYLDVVETQIKKYVIERFKNLKEDKKKYLFFLDLHNINGGDDFATMLLNPNRLDLIGKKLSDSYKDPKGKEFRKEFLKDLRQTGESYTKYWYKKPNMQNPKSKISYFYLQKDWNWIIASGFYLDDLERQIDKVENEFVIYTNNTIYKTLIIIVLLSFIIIIIAILISIKIDKTIKDYTDTIILYKDKERQQEHLIIEQAKMVQMGEMIGNIAHQWRQPLSVISTAASGILVSKEYDTLSQSQENEMLNNIMENTQFLSDTIDIFRNYIREKKEIKEVVLQTRIHNALNIIEASLKNHHIELINNIDNYEPVKITMIVGELSQVIINLINNAKDILVENNITQKIIKIDLIIKEDIATITIEDNGGGIPSDILEKIFDPYFTTKHQSQGTGLGLHMSKDIIEHHLNGKLYAKNIDNGAKFFIELPIEKMDI